GIDLGRRHAGRHHGRLEVVARRPARPRATPGEALEVPQLGPRLRVATGRKPLGVVRDVDRVHLEGDAVRVDGGRVHVGRLPDTGVDLLVQAVGGAPPEPGAARLNDVPLRIIALDL